MNAERSDQEGRGADTGSPSQPHVIKLRCRHCNGLNLLPVPKAPLSAPSDPRIVAERTLRLMVDWLTRNAQDPERIGKRVQQLAFAMKREDQREKQSTLAKRQKVSPAHISRAVEEASELVREVGKVNFGSVGENPRQNDPVL